MCSVPYEWGRKTGFVGYTIYQTRNGTEQRMGGYSKRFILYCAPQNIHPHPSFVRQQRLGSGRQLAGSGGQCFVYAKAELDNILVLELPRKSGIQLVIFLHSYGCGHKFG